MASTFEGSTIDVLQRHGGCLSPGVKSDSTRTLEGKANIGIGDAAQDPELFSDIMRLHGKLADNRRRFDGYPLRLIRS